MWTYEPEKIMEDDLHWVRFMVQDTLDDEPLITDKEIRSLLSVHNKHETAKIVAHAIYLLQARADASDSCLAAYSNFYIPGGE